MSLSTDVRQALQDILGSSNVRLKFRQGNASEWTTKNPVLLSGEPGYELGSGKEKRGDGVTDWNNLPYTSDGFLTGASVMAYLPFTRPEDFGAKGDGVTDDTAAIQAALNTGNAVILAKKKYAINGFITVNSGQMLRGMGGMRSTTGTVLVCKSLNSGVRFFGDAPFGADFTVDALAANVGIQVGGINPGESGSDGIFSNIMVQGAQQINWYFGGSQNFLVQSCRSQNGARDGLVVDFSVGGALFERFEAAGAARYNVYITQNAVQVGGYARVADTVFNKLIAEQAVGDYPQVFIEKAYSVTFNQLSVFCSKANPTAPLIRSSASGVVTFNDPIVLGQPGQTAFEGVYLATEGVPAMAVAGIVQNGTSGNSALFKADAYSTVYYTGFCPSVIAGVVKLLSPTTSMYSVRNESSVARFPVGQAASDYSEASKVRGDAQYRFIRTVDGAMVWGSGAAFADTTLYRYSPGVLASNGGFRANRFVANTVTVSPVGGVVTVDASASQMQAVYLATAATSLVINNMSDGQRLTLTFTQPAAPVNFNLAAVSGTQADGVTAIAGVQWQGGAPPYIGRGSYAVTSEFRMIAGFLYEVGRSQTEPSLFVDTAANLAPLVPRIAQKVYETDTKRTREGDGVSTVANLPYVPKRWRIRGSARWNAVNDYGLTLSTVPITDGLVVYVPWDLDEPMTIDQWAVTRTTIGVGGSQSISCALYTASLSTNLPVGGPLYGLDTAAPAIDLTTGTANALGIGVLSAPVTIPAGRYWVGVKAARSGSVTTIAAVAYLAAQDPRLSAPNGFNFYSYASALFSSGSATFQTNPTMGATTYYGLLAWFHSMS